MALVTNGAVLQRIGVCAIGHVYARVVEIDKIDATIYRGRYRGRNIGTCGTCSLAEDQHPEKILGVGKQTFDSA